LIHQTIARPNYEIIVVNYGGENEQSTQALLAEIDSKIRYIYTCEKGIWCNAAAKNIGAKAALADIICFLNPDGLFEEHFLEKILEMYADYKGRVLIQSRRYDLNADITARIMSGAYNDKLWQLFFTKECALHSNRAEGDCQCFPKSVFFKIGGYDEDFKGWGFDDSDFAQRMTAYGLQKVWLDHEQIHLLHLHHKRDLVMLEQNRALRRERKGVIVRNQGREWGKVKPC